MSEAKEYVGEWDDANASARCYIRAGEGEAFYSFALILPAHPIISAPLSRSLHHPLQFTLLEEGIQAGSMIQGSSLTKGPPQ